MFTFSSWAPRGRMDARPVRVTQDKPRAEPCYHALVHELRPRPSTLLVPAHGRRGLRPRPGASPPGKSPGGSLLLLFRLAPGPVPRQPLAFERHPGGSPHPGEGAEPCLEPAGLATTGSAGGRSLRPLPASTRSAALRVQPGAAEEPRHSGDGLHGPGAEAPFDPPPRPRGARLRLGPGRHDLRPPDPGHGLPRDPRDPGPHGRLVAAGPRLARRGVRVPRDRSHGRRAARRVLARLGPGGGGPGGRHPRGPARRPLDRRRDLPRPRRRPLRRGPAAAPAGEEPALRLERHRLANPGVLPGDPWPLARPLRSGRSSWGSTPASSRARPPAPDGTCGTSCGSGLAIPRTGSSPTSAGRTPSIPRWTRSASVVGRSGP